MRFYVYAPSYDENSGGCIVLHRLCHLINEFTEHEAFIIPRKMERVDITSTRKIISSFIKATRLKYKKFHINERWNTPVSLNVENPEADIVVYSEIVFGNPLQAKNIVRWYLHHPGHLRDDVFYSKGELCFRFHSGINKYKHVGATLSESLLNVLYYPTDIYFDSNEKRDIVTYMVRKGKSKPQIHDEDAVCVDGLNHEETAKLFRRSKQFICYDDYTAYSTFAALCGAVSIVVPEKGVELATWQPLENERYGVAYGDDSQQLAWAKSSLVQLKGKVEAEEFKSRKAAHDFVKECHDFFFSDNLENDKM
jgi:hypothetical protein